MYGCEFYSRELPKILKINAATTAEELAVANSWYAYSYDGTQFNFDDPVFLSAMTDLTDAITGGYCTPALDAETLQSWYYDSSYTPTYNGKVALWREASWSVKNHFSEMLFNWDVYPGPDGIMGGNTDIAGISTTTEHPEAAYQLLKWMSYSEEGLLTRFQLFEDYSDQVTISANNYGYPVVDYGIDGYGHNHVWEAIPYDITAPGFTSPEFIEALRNGAYWINKETVGWDEADSYGYDYIYSVMVGETTYAAIAETFQTEAMTAMNNARTALDALIAQYRN
jgi:ABC-type glycerol-3-phosphate transport system substrate-binding protein